MIKSVPVILIEDIDADRRQRGFATLETWQQYLYLRMLYVHPKCRRQGVATALIQYAKTLAMSYGGLALTPESWGGNPMRVVQLCEWYRRNGFNPCADAEGVFIWLVDGASEHEQK